MAPREFTLLALRCSAEAKATRATFGIEGRQAKGALHARVALEADYQ